MHRIVKYHMQDFVSEFEIGEHDESVVFEMFVNYSIGRSLSSGPLDPIEMVYDGADPGIDGFIALLNGEQVSSVEEASDVFEQAKNDVDAHFVFTQAKTSETWKKSDINVFQAAISDFVSESPKSKMAPELISGKEIFDLVISKVGRLRGGMPSVSAHFVNTAPEPQADEILAARSTIEDALKATGLFKQVNAELVSRDDIIRYWTSTREPVESSLDLLGNAAFPDAPGIEQSLVVTVNAKDFIENVLTDEYGRLRRRIFDENVRDFIGIDGDVNSEIADSIRDSEKRLRFGILNNGVTIISPDVRIANAGRTLSMRDYQIVNGCQTSNVLFECREFVGDHASVVLKIVQTADRSVVEDIVRSTNKQTNVAESQFLSTMKIVKRVEQNFVSRSTDDKYNLYFERRTDQFLGDDRVKKIRVFDIREIARCVAAVFLDKPDLASRYPNRLTGDLKDVVYDESYNDEIYYAAAYCLYRVRVLIAGSRVDQKYEKLRWHIILAIR